MSLTTAVSVKANRVSTKTKDCFQLQTGIMLGFAARRSVIGYDNSCHPLHQSNAKLKTIDDKKKT